MGTTGWSRPVSGAAFAAKLALRRPAHVAEMLRGVGAAILDAQFESRSRIEPISQLVDETLGRQTVTLPPRRAFGPGTQDVAGLRVLIELARAINVASVFEIGTFTGTTTLALAMNLPDAAIHTLDLPSDVGSTALPTYASDPANIAARTSPVFVDRPEAARIVEHFGDSARFDFEPFRGRIGLVYVDGAHSLPYLVNDTRAAELMVAPGGAIVWDDYWRRTPDVANYLHGRADKALRRIPGTRLVVWLSDLAALSIQEMYVAGKAPLGGPVKTDAPRGRTRSR